MSLCYSRSCVKGGIGHRSGVPQRAPLVSAGRLISGRGRIYRACHFLASIVERTERARSTRRQQLILVGTAFGLFGPLASFREPILVRIANCLVTESPPQSRADSVVGLRDDWGGQEAAPAWLNNGLPRQVFFSGCDELNAGLRLFARSGRESAGGTSSDLHHIWRTPSCAGVDA